MAFTVRCGKCHESISKHIVVRGEHGHRTVCPEDHLAKWLKKWDWKFTKADGSFDYERAQRAWERTVARLPKPGQSHGTRRPSPGSKPQKRKTCGYCGAASPKLEEDKKYGQLCLRCHAHVKRARRSSKEFDRDAERYFVTVTYLAKGKIQQTILILRASSSHDARRLSKKDFRLGKWLGATATKVKTNQDPSLSRKAVSRKIRLLMHEGYPQKQAVAIAFRMLKKNRRHGKSRARLTPKRNKR